MLVAWYARRRRSAPTYSAPGTTKETLDTTASNAVNNAISFVLYNEAIYQFVQWFASETHVDLQVLLYDSVDAYIADCQLAPNEVLAHICTAIDYKDNDKLLEEHVNHMAKNTLRPEGVCVKLVTRPGETLPGVYVEDRNGCARRTHPETTRTHAHTPSQGTSSPFFFSQTALYTVYSPPCPLLRVLSRLSQECAADDDARRLVREPLRRPVPRV